MKIKSPYDFMTLQIASLSMIRKVQEYLVIHGEEKANTVIDEVMEHAPTPAKIAAFVGVSLDNLVASPNYEKFKEEYMHKAINAVVTSLQEEMKLDEKEVWALLVADQLNLVD